ncbi:MAG: sugar ABC transporter ATP-binding protein [Clostridia bacterium]|nr:sugar ABC transporter ATP-binding protein [Clostridia bacterium]
MEGICKYFPGVMALDNARLTVKAGTVHALMGENGAGKSTLMKCLFGVYKKDSGKIRIFGNEVNFQNAKDALCGGVAMVHQELSQALQLSVMDNMFLGRYPKISRFLPLTSEKALYEMTREIFDELDININPKAKMDSLSVSKRQMIEIAKAVSYKARVIVFDEPTSSLTENEAEKLFEIIDKLKKRGCAIIYISHKMDEILRICDEITVMRDGKHIKTAPAAELTTDEIIRLMVGRTLNERYPKKTNTIGEELLRVENLECRSARLKNINFSLQKGEILGIAGLDGAGRSEVLETIFGLRPLDYGEIFLNGKKIKNSEPSAAIRNGFALVTEERRQTGIFSILSIVDNTVIANIKKFRTGPFLSRKMMTKETKNKIGELKIKTPSEKAKIENLSGGNQQKVIISRWLLTSPAVFMLDEPTRGIDIGAKFEIYKLILELANEGRGIILVSSEMGELLGLCDRIAVMSGGRIAGVVSKEDATQEKILELASIYA